MTAPSAEERAFFKFCRWPEGGLGVIDPNDIESVDAPDGERQFSYIVTKRMQGTQRVCIRVAGDRESIARAIRAQSPPAMGEKGRGE